MNTITQAAKKNGVRVQWLNRNKIRHDMGKYTVESKHKPTPPEHADKVLWYELRKDSYGPYLAVYTVNR